MAFIKIPRSEKRKMYQAGGYRERSAMDEMKSASSLHLETQKGTPDCIKVTKKNGSTCVWSVKRQAWVN